MQFYLVQRPQDYFTFLPKIAPTRTLFGVSAKASPSPHGIVWARHSRTSVGSITENISKPTKLSSSQRLVSFLLGAITLGIAVPWIAQHSSPLTTASMPVVSSQQVATTNITSTNTAQKILAQKLLTLAVVEQNADTGNSDNAVNETNKAIDPRFIQDYGQAIAQRFANQLGVNLAVTRYSTLAQAQQAIATGQADVLMTSTPAQNSNTIPTVGIIHAAYHPNNNAISTSTSLASNDLATVTVACQARGAIQTNVTWQMKPSEDKFPNQVQEFLCHHKVQHDTLWDFFTQNTLQHSFNQAHFSEAVSQTLPRLKPIFQQNAQTYHHDWKMLAAVAYQESHLRSTAVSPTGVRGIMMLTTDTAKAMGVSNRTDPNQSIKGGAKYLEILQNQFAAVPKSDRLWFTLAAYNMGPMAILNIQDKLQKSGKDANSWAEVYHYMMINKKYTPRYIQCMDYVSNIHGYLTLLNQSNPTTGALATQTA